jgi:DNA-binding Lrp family transcriptional regulator
MTSALRAPAARLSTKERKILAALSLSPLSDGAALAKTLGMHTANVQYSLRSLQEREIYSIRPFINQMLLGYEDLAVFMNLAAMRPERREKVMSEIVTSPMVSWCSQLIGDYELVVGVLTTRINELATFFDYLRKDGGDVFSNRAIVPRIAYHQYIRKGIMPTIRVPAPLSITDSIKGGLSKPIVLDELDKKILRSLANAKGSSRRELARELSIPPSTLLHRIRSLEKSKLIAGYFLQLDSRHLGMQDYRLLVECRSLTTALRKKLELCCRQHPSVYFLVEDLGPYDFEIGISAPDPFEVGKVSAEITAVLGKSLHSVKSLTEVADLKWSFFPW